jgi:phosphatidylserine decarboxylase
VVSPADGKVTSIGPVTVEGRTLKRISIFLNVFNVHVNRSPISGIIRGARYEPGKFLNAMNPGSAEHNERNTVTIEGEGHQIIFKQIAGLLARRIVFTKKIGDTVRRGERVGLIKFGSRTDVLLDASADIAVSVGDNVKGGTSILAFLEPKETELAGASEREQRRKS